MPSKETSVDKAPSSGPSEKAGRGFTNLALGWTEIPRKIMDTTKETNPIQGLIWGTWQGTVKALARTTSGVADLATFPIGKYDKPVVFPDISKTGE